MWLLNGSRILHSNSNSLFFPVKFQEMADNRIVYDDVSQLLMLNRWDAPTPGYCDGSSVTPLALPRIVPRSRRQTDSGFSHLINGKTEKNTTNSHHDMFATQSNWNLQLVGLSRVLRTGWNHNLEFYHSPFLHILLVPSCFLRAYTLPVQLVWYSHEIGRLALCLNALSQQILTCHGRGLVQGFRRILSDKQLKH